MIPVYYATELSIGAISIAISAAQNANAEEMSPSLKYSHLTIACIWKKRDVFMSAASRNARDCCS